MKGEDFYSTENQFIEIMKAAYPQGVEPHLGFDSMLSAIGYHYDGKLEDCMESFGVSIPQETLDIYYRFWVLSHDTLPSIVIWDTGNGHGFFVCLMNQQAIEAYIQLCEHASEEQA